MNDLKQVDSEGVISFKNNHDHQTLIGPVPQQDHNDYAESDSGDSDRRGFRRGHGNDECHGGAYHMGEVTNPSRTSSAA